MGYSVEGDLLEVCDCNVLCPCWIGEDPDNGTCDTALAYRSAPARSTGWTSAASWWPAGADPRQRARRRLPRQLYVDARADDAQAAALIDLMLGRKGGPFADMAGLVGRRCRRSAAADHLRSPRARAASASACRRGGDDALSRPDRAGDDAEREHLLDHPRLAGLRRQGRALPVHEPALGIDLDLEATTPSRAMFRFERDPPVIAAATQRRGFRRGRARARGARLVLLVAWSASPWARYLDHGDWTADGVLGSICAALPAGGALMPAVALRRRLGADADPR